MLLPVKQRKIVPEAANVCNIQFEFVIDFFAVHILFARCRFSPSMSLAKQLFSVTSITYSWHVRRLRLASIAWLQFFPRFMFLPSMYEWQFYLKLLCCINYMYIYTQLCMSIFHFADRQQKQWNDDYDDGKSIRFSAREQKITKNNNNYTKQRIARETNQIDCMLCVFSFALCCCSS